MEPRARLPRSLTARGRDLYFPSRGEDPLLTGWRARSNRSFRPGAERRSAIPRRNSDWRESDGTLGDRLRLARTAHGLNSRACQPIDHRPLHPQGVGSKCPCSVAPPSCDSRRLARKDVNVPDRRVHQGASRARVAGSGRSGYAHLPVTRRISRRALAGDDCLAPLNRTQRKPWVRSVISSTAFQPNITGAAQRLRSVCASCRAATPPCHLR